MFSTAALLVLGMLAFLQLREGGPDQLKKWAKAKFLNAADPNRPAKEAIETGIATGLGAGGFGLGGATGPSGLTNPLPGGKVSPQGHFGDCRAGCSRRHQGIDLFLPRGTPIRAAGPGRVTFAGASGLYGLRVDVDHGNGWLTRYGHLDRIGVQVGQVVSTGAALGTLGGTGNADAPHLHFETHQNGTPVDPAGVIPGIGAEALA